ncbi:expressed unknown protein [Seminavis robusta]|uniref:G-protein coupled receptors family 2 profile 2 domain-containing protein n=1 Tax=Seminavis robusta TaxID=568900 RepID=A0A9N8H5W1_9STRA|nr:expressed unknown protein [Seminavis robusta]|eukprot:Sro125_g060390.1 n/a (775) ;mRNA; f:105900-108410
MPCSPAQQTALAVIPKISSLLSLCGSTWIFIEVLWGCLPNNQQRPSRRNIRACDEGKLKREHPYHRLLFAMSVYDILESIWNFGSTWPLPTDTPSAAGSFWQPVGSTQSCTAQGFFLQLAVAIPIYNCCLSLYYLLVINYRFTDTHIGKWIEPSMHAVAFVWGFGTALAASVMGYMNNANLWCWIAPYPSGCLAEDNGIECTRGQHTFLIRWVFYFTPLWTSIFAATVFTLMVYVYVKKIDKKSSRYRAFSDETNSGGYASGVSQQSSRYLDVNGNDAPASDRNLMVVSDDDNNNSQPNNIQPPTSEIDHNNTGQNDDRKQVDASESSPDRRSFLTKERVSFMGTSVRFGSSSSWGLRSATNRGSMSDGSGNNGETAGNRSSIENNQLDPSDASMATRKQQRFLERWRKRQEDQRRMNRRTIEVFHQAVFYMGAFYLTHVWSTTNRIIQQLNGGSTVYGLILIHSFFDPFQGFMNFLCYQRPRYLRERKQNSELGRWFAVKRILRFSFLPDPDVSETEVLFQQAASRSQQSSKGPDLRVSATHGCNSSTLATLEAPQPRQSLVAELSSCFELPIHENDEYDELALFEENETPFGPEFNLVANKYPDKSGGSSKSNENPSLDDTLEPTGAKPFAHGLDNMHSDEADLEADNSSQQPLYAESLDENHSPNNNESTASGRSEIKDPIKHPSSGTHANAKVVSSGIDELDGVADSETSSYQEEQTLYQRSMHDGLISGLPHDRSTDTVLIEADPDLLSFAHGGTGEMEECSSSGIWSV